MSLQTEGVHAGEFIITEQAGRLSRDTVTVTVPASTTLPAGRVLAKIAADGKHVEYDNAGSDGSEAASGVLYDSLVNDTGAPVDMDGVVVNFGAEVRREALSYKSGLVDADELAAEADLASLFIKVREG